MFDSVWCLTMAQIQFSLIKKIRTLATLHPLTSDNITFLPYPPPPHPLPPPPQSGRHMCVTPYFSRSASVLTVSEKFCTRKSCISSKIKHRAKQRHSCLEITKWSCWTSWNNLLQQECFRWEWKLTNKIFLR